MLIGDKAYDSDGIDPIIEEKYGVELIAPHKRNRKAPVTQDGRKLRRYKKRWKVERCFAWIQNYRKLVTRYERKAENFLAMVKLAAILILIRHL
jgi:transposase